MRFVGLDESALREIRYRVQGAIKAAGFDLPIAERSGSQSTAPSGTPGRSPAWMEVSLSVVSEPGHRLSPGLDIGTAD